MIKSSLLLLNPSFCWVCSWFAAFIISLWLFLFNLLKTFSIRNSNALLVLFSTKHLIQFIHYNMRYCKKHYSDKSFISHRQIFRLFVLSKTVIFSWDSADLRKCVTCAFSSVCLGKHRQNQSGMTLLLLRNFEMIGKYFKSSYNKKLTKMFLAFSLF